MLSKSNMKTRLNTIIDSEVLDRIGQKMKNNISETNKNYTKIMPYLTGKNKIEDICIYEGNIEKFYGLAQIPVGLMGPIKVNGAYGQGLYHVPLATTEGALVASYNRGAKVVTMSGGVNVLCVSETITRSPGFIFNGILESTKFVAWVSENFQTFKDIARSTTSHGHLEDFDAMIDGKYVWINFKFVSGDAAGQNMVTIATDAICKYIQEMSPIQPTKWYIDANLSGDKKATKLSQVAGRGKHMVAELTIPRKVMKRLLHTTPEDFVEYSKMAMVAGIHSGAMGVNGHFANGLTALFIACGQDVACVGESSTGSSKAELTKEGDVYVSVSLPNLVVGTVGGGTHLPTQRESLEIMGCFGQGNSKKFAEITAATVLAGEISIAAAICAGHFTQAHKKYGRKNKLNKGIKDVYTNTVR